MKKILSVALALVMALAICVPAFAVKTISDKEPGAATSIVKTSTLKEDGTSGESYKVIIPANTTIPWGNPSADLIYSAEAHLGYGKKLRVTVEGNNKMVLKEDASETLEYALSGDVSYVSDRPVVNGVSKTVTLLITEKAWANAIVGAYTGILTFTAAVVK